MGFVNVLLVSVFVVCDKYVSNVSIVVWRIVPASFVTIPSVPATAVVPGVVLPSTIFNSVAVDDTDTPPICKVVVFNVVVVAVPDTCN